MKYTQRRQASSAFKVHDHESLPEAVARAVESYMQDGQIPTTTSYTYDHSTQAHGGYAKGFHGTYSLRLKKICHSLRGLQKCTPADVLLSPVATDARGARRSVWAAAMALQRAMNGTVIG